jgi:hypothetical protein
LPDFSCHNIPKRGKICQIAYNLPNGSDIFKNNMSTVSILRASKIYPNLDLWFENIWHSWFYGAQKEGGNFSGRANKKSFCSELFGTRLGNLKSVE